MDKLLHMGHDAFIQYIQDVCFFLILFSRVGYNFYKDRVWLLYFEYEVSLKYCELIEWVDKYFNLMKYIFFNDFFMLPVLYSI